MIHSTKIQNINKCAHNHWLDTFSMAMIIFHEIIQGG
jgi:hypothetical protein